MNVYVVKYGGGIAGVYDSANKAMDKCKEIYKSECGDSINWTEAAWIRQYTDVEWIELNGGVDVDSLKEEDVCCSECGSYKTIREHEHHFYCKNCESNFIHYKEEQIKDEPKRIPLTPDDFGPVTWVRWIMLTKNCYSAEFMAVAIDEDGIKLMDDKEDSGFCDYEFLMNINAEYSTDRKNWKPCWKLEV